MKKELFIILCLSSGFQLNADWCMPKHPRLVDIDTDTGHPLDGFHGDCSQDSRYQNANDIQMVGMCNATPKRPGCFDKNRHGQAFCESYTGGGLIGNCSKRNWDDWKNERHYAIGEVGNHLENCPKACQTLGKVWEKDFLNIDGITLCHCK